jgi:hypothetical protein
VGSAFPRERGAKASFEQTGDIASHLIFMVFFNYSLSVAYHVAAATGARG